MKETADGKGERRMKITVIAFGTLSEKHFADAFAEYRRRLAASCTFECVELKEKRLAADPSPAEIAAALEAEGRQLLEHIPRRACTVVMAIEGKTMSSDALSSYMDDRMSAGTSEFVFVIGSSYGLSPEVKRRADLLLSMSPMTFPHQLARVMLAEQLYRAAQIRSGTKYHK